MIHFERLIPTLYSIAKEENMDLGVADDMLLQCIQSGQAVYKGADGPVDCAPNYTALKAEYGRIHTEHEKPGVNAEFNAFIKKRKAYFSQLCKLWNEKRCYAMMDLMVTDDGVDYGIGEFANTLEEALEKSKKPWEVPLIEEVTEDGD